MSEQNAERPFSSASFYQYLNEKKLMGSKCKIDGKLYLPPRALCSADYSTEMEWVQFSGRGKLAAFSIIYIGPNMMLAEGYDRKNPYCAGVVELEEGPKISAQIVEVDVNEPDTIQVGMPVELVFIQRGHDEKQQTHLAFRPAGM